MFDMSSLTSAMITASVFSAEGLNPLFAQQQSLRHYFLRIYQINLFCLSFWQQRADHFNSKYDIALHL